MSDRSRDTTHRHPAEEREADQSTQSASGLGSARPRRGTRVSDDVLNRNAPARSNTPRQYEENDADDRDNDR